MFFLSAIVLGLVSSLHCVAMCGPIAMMLPVSQYNPEKKALQLLTYHIGRMTSYTSIGCLFGSLGRGFQLAGIQQQLSLIAGIVMITIAVMPATLFARYNFSKPVFKVISKAKSALGQQMRNQSFKSLFTIGLLNGFLPCAMVYAALFGAMATQGILSGASYMAFFGLGTIPLMSIIVYVKNWLTFPIQNKIQKIIPFAVGFVGVLLILRGLSLGIHNLSPSMMNLFITSEPDCS